MNKLVRFLIICVSILPCVFSACGENLSVPDYIKNHVGKVNVREVRVWQGGTEVSHSAGNKNVYAIEPEKETTLDLNLLNSHSYVLTPKLAYSINNAPWLDSESETGEVQLTSVSLTEVKAEIVSPKDKTRYRMHLTLRNEETGVTYGPFGLPTIEYGEVGVIPPEPITVSITGIEGVSGAASIYLYENSGSINSGSWIAKGNASVTGNNAIFDLNNPSGEPFTESGSYLIKLEFGSIVYFYTAGNELGALSGLPKNSISSDGVNSIEWNQFATDSVPPLPEPVEITGYQLNGIWVNPENPSKIRAGEESVLKVLLDNPDDVSLSPKLVYGDDWQESAPAEYAAAGISIDTANSSDEVIIVRIGNPAKNVTYKLGLKLNDIETGIHALPLMTGYEPAIGDPEPVIITGFELNGEEVSIDDTYEIKVGEESVLKVLLDNPDDVSLSPKLVYGDNWQESAPAEYAAAGISIDTANSSDEVIIVRIGNPAKDVTYKLGLKLSGTDTAVRALPLMTGYEPAIGDPEPVIITGFELNGEEVSIDDTYEIKAGEESVLKVLLDNPDDVSLSPKLVYGDNWQESAPAEYAAAGISIDTANSSDEVIIVRIGNPAKDVTYKLGLKLSGTDTARALPLMKCRGDGVVGTTEVISVSADWTVTPSDRLPNDTYLLSGTETTLTVSFDIRGGAEITPELQYLYNDQMTTTNPWAADTQFIIDNYKPGDKTVTIKISNPKPYIFYDSIYLKLFDEDANMVLKDKEGNTISDPGNAYILPYMRGKIDIENVTLSIDSSSMTLNGGLYTIPLKTASTLTVTLDNPNNDYSLSPVLVYESGAAWSENNPWADVGFNLTSLSGNPVDKPKFTVTVTPEEINAPVTTTFKIGLKLVNPDDNSEKVLELDAMKLAEPKSELTVTIKLDDVQEKVFVEETTETIPYDGSNFTITIKDGFTVDMWYLDGDGTGRAGAPVISGGNPGVYRVKIIAKDSGGRPYSNDMTITIE